MLFGDIVGSSERAAELGDDTWRPLLDRHTEVVHRELRRFGGREVDSAGDGFLATFDSPARAIRCACTVREELAELGISARFGLHTGECEVVRDKLRGIAVHIGARVAAEAGPGEVLVSTTVKDLVAGRRVQFEERGVRTLKGIPGSWPLFAVRAPIGASSSLRRSVLVGREQELDQVESWLVSISDGGGLALVAGDAGIGKTRLVEEIVRRSGLPALTAGATEVATPPYGPLVVALRAHLRKTADGLDCGPLSAHLALVLPELGVPPPGSADRPSLFEAIRCAFACIARTGPTVVVLDDLQWADDATLELLPTLAATLEREPLLLLGLYRSDELPRGHALRRLRTELRRAGRLRELTLEALSAQQTEALATSVFGRRPSASLSRIIHDRTQGIPLFIEELAVALESSGRLLHSRGGVELTGGEDVPVPDSVRDAVLLRAEALSDEARAALEYAAVCGNSFSLDLVADLAGEAALDEPIMLGFIVERDSGLARFRHALTREALYEAVPWSRRAELHRRIAGRLESVDADAVVVAEHWLRGRRPDRARAAFLAAAEQACAVYAHRDAAQLGQRALDLWPDGEDESGRLAALERIGSCLEFCGDLAAATRTWQELLERQLDSGVAHELAVTHRRLASLYELQGMWDRAVLARRAAARNFRAAEQPGEATLDGLAGAGVLQGGGSFTPALEMLATACTDAQRAGRVDLRARVLALEGLVRARLGERARGLEMVHDALSLALSENLVGAATEIQLRLGFLLWCTSDYPRAEEHLSAAHELCETTGIRERAAVCRASLINVLRKMGRWQEALAISGELLDDEDASAACQSAAHGVIGLIRAMRGEAKAAKPSLVKGYELAVRTNLLPQEFDCPWGLARLDELGRAYDSAAARCRALLVFWADTEDGYFALGSLRWASTFFATQDDPAGTGACAEALSRMAVSTGNAEALSALAHALGEVAMLEGDTSQAEQQFRQAIELLHELELPLEYGETQLRLGIALAAAGDRDAAVQQLTDAYQTVKRLGARPLMIQIVAELAKLGERVEQRLGRKAARDFEFGGLSRREFEILRSVAVGRTNREIARELFLSPRTVDMHVRNILRKLGARSRAEAVARAADAGILAG